MALRLHRLTDDQWQRLAASRRGQPRASTPPRAAISAIEVELHAVTQAVSAASFGRTGSTTSTD